MTHNSLPVWRSLLYVPVINPRFVEKSADSGADGVILDLEDSIPPPDKERARTLLAEASAQAARGGADILVRVEKALDDAGKSAKTSAGEPTKPTRPLSSSAIASPESFAAATPDNKAAPAAARKN